MCWPGPSHHSPPQQTWSYLLSGTLKKYKIGHAHQAPTVVPVIPLWGEVVEEPPPMQQNWRLVAERFMGSEVGLPQDYAPVAETTEITPPGRGHREDTTYRTC